MSSQAEVLATTVYRANPYIIINNNNNNYKDVHFDTSQKTPLAERYD